ncbi:MAG TPA: right-handed parallel beta-helix repeat-containing protein, partial [bacterium]|nr:right-handed parallel beta-helix repeat-containing protein [bacterium]
MKMRNIITILTFLLIYGSSSTLATTIIVCQDCGVGDFDNISDAILAATTGDTINVIAEETFPGSGVTLTYNEHVLIDKQIFLTCLEPLSNAGNPSITGSFTSDNEVIRITATGAGTHIKNIDIHGPVGDNTQCATDPLDCLMDRAGIRIEADNCTLENCRIIRCFSGIVVGDYSQQTGRSTSIIGCTVGDIWTEFYNDEWQLEAYWTQSHYYDGIGFQPIIHPGNGFGIVAVETDWTAPASGYESIEPMEIVDCTIQSNRYYGVVLTNGSKAQVNHNIIAFNGDFTATVSGTVPDKTGGLLSLFTHAQITDSNNDNKLQSPVIRSNNIYGNKGYQIGIFTEHSDKRKIWNSPVLMSNTIGIEPGSPPITSTDQFDFLICCGPTPDLPPTPPPTHTPTPGGSTPTNTPLPTNAPGWFSYNYHGSGPILAWNNLNDITAGRKRRIYHPMQPDTEPPAVAFTPVPTDTPPGPSPTPAPTDTPPHTPTALSIEPTPTGIPWSPSPTPVHTYTPAADYYRANSRGWLIMPRSEDPHFAGWVTPTPEGPPYYDWRVLDYNVSPTPTAPSINLNHGGFNLNPGAATSSMYPDTGFVDLGLHVQSDLPPVEYLSATYRVEELILTWYMPVYYPDGSLINPYDIAGTIVTWGKKEQISPGGGGFIQPIEKITVIGEPIYLDGQTQRYDTEELYPGATHMGVRIYSTRGMESALEWTEI